MSDVGFTPCGRCQPHRQQNVTSASLGVSTPDCLLPPLLIESRPVLVVQPFDVVLGEFAPEEQKILYQVDCRKGRLAAVENLEDDLRVVIVVEINDNQLEEAGECVSQRQQSLRINPAICIGCVVEGRLGEEPAGLQIKVVVMVVVGRNVVSERDWPKFSVLATWPQLVDFFGRLNDVVRVEQHPANRLRALGLVRDENVEQTANEQLDSRQPLLAVNHRPERHPSCRKGQAGADNSTKEVR